MVEHGEVFYEKLLFSRAASTLKIHGIVSIVFGSLGVLGALIFTLFLMVASYTDDSFNGYDSTMGIFFVSALIFVFWILPHVYLIVAGTYLMRQPSPKIAKTIVIINLVIGVFWNLVLLIFAIINLTQFTDYERGYHLHKQ